MIHCLSRVMVNLKKRDPMAGDTHRMRGAGNNGNFLLKSVLRGREREIVCKGGEFISIGIHFKQKVSQRLK